MLAGRLFHATGPATEKALFPSFVRVFGTSKCPSVADRFVYMHYKLKKITDGFIQNVLGQKEMSFGTGEDQIIGLK